MLTPDLKNFRDLGGLPTTDGRKVRSRVIYRSRQLLDIKGETVQDLLGRLGMRTLIDLRTESEMDKWGKYEDRHLNGINYINIQVMASGIPVDEALKESQGYDGIRYLYYHILKNEGGLFKEWFKVLSEEENLPVLIHCIAGKDRTGLFVALLLLSLAVHESDVKREYLLSAPGQELCFETMTRLIEEWGGIENTLFGMGIDNDLVSKVRENLLEGR